MRDILATLETVYQPLFPQLNLRQWAGTLYTWLTHPVLDPTHTGRVTMDNLMKLDTTALEWTRSGLEKRMCEPSGSSPPPSCLCCVMILLAIIDGAGPDAHAEDQDAETKDRANGKEPERQTVQENERASTTKTVEMAEEPVQTSASPKCTFSRTVVAIDLKRFTASSVTSVECPDCGRTHSLSQSRASSGSLRTTDAKCRPKFMASVGRLREKRTGTLSAGKKASQTTR